VVVLKDAQFVVALASVWNASIHTVIHGAVFALIPEIVRNVMVQENVLPVINDRECLRMKIRELMIRSEEAIEYDLDEASRLLRQTRMAMLLDVILDEEETKEYLKTLQAYKQNLIDALEEDNV